MPRVAGARAAEVALLRPSADSAITQGMVASVVAAGAPEHPVLRAGEAAAAAVAGAVAEAFEVVGDFDVNAQKSMIDVAERLEAGKCLTYFRFGAVSLCDSCS